MNFYQYVLRAKRINQMTTTKTFSFHDFIPNTLFSLAGQNAVIIGAGGAGLYTALEASKTARYENKDRMRKNLIK